MKIGMVCYPSVGGSGIVAGELGIGLMERGHEIHFFSYDIPHRLVGMDGNFQFHHVDVPIYPVFRFPPYTLALATTITEVAIREHLDLVHVHYAVPHSTSALLAKMMACHYSQHQLRIITTLHGTDIDLVGKEPSYKTITEYSINSSDAVTAVSDYLKRATHATFDVRREIHVIHNPIDTRTFRPLQEMDEDRPDPDRKTILHISNFRRVKRVTDAVKILDLVRNSAPVQLLFLGDGPERQAAESTAQQLGIKDRVIFAGQVQNVENWLRKGDLLLSTSEIESFGMSIAEAMATGLPVVAYEVGGVPEVIGDSRYGRLVPKGDVCGAAKAISEILCNSCLARNLGSNARKRIEEQFRWDLICRQYETLYEEVLDAAPSHPIPGCEKVIQSIRPVEESGTS